MTMHGPSPQGRIHYDDAEFTWKPFLAETTFQGPSVIQEVASVLLLNSQYD